jgi:hypothetical protein
VLGAILEASMRQESVGRQVADKLNKKISIRYDKIKDDYDIKDDLGKIKSALVSFGNRMVHLESMYVSLFIREI